MPKYNNYLAGRELEDHQIKSKTDNSVLGWICVKQSGIVSYPKNMTYGYAFTLDELNE
jgi:hypothetical protein